jgi:SAM-dependent methyltransferase
MSEPVKLHLGCGQVYKPGWVNCDLNRDVRADVYFDLDAFPWPFRDDFADEILLDQVMEHLADTLKVMTEIHRVLKPGGIVRIQVPYAKSDCAFQDPTHRQFFTERTMDYFTENCPYNYYTRCRFKLLRAELTTMNLTRRLRIRNLIPFRNVLRWFFWNLYDGVTFELQKTRAKSSAST